MHPRLRVFTCALALVASCATSLVAQADTYKVGAVSYTHLTLPTILLV